jgi:hypothetical protein
VASRRAAHDRQLHRRAATAHGSRLADDLGWCAPSPGEDAASPASGVRSISIGEHAVEVVGLTPALLYFGFIVWKGTLGLGDSAVLLTIYATYLWVLNRIPPKEHEEEEDAGVVPRTVLSFPAALASSRPCCCSSSAARCCTSVSTRSCRA